MAAPHVRHLQLTLACGCKAGIARKPHTERFWLARFTPACTRHQPEPGLEALIRGFGPYPDWDANVIARLQSVPEAGGMMEGEHAFILDEQFLFLEYGETVRPVGPIKEARWAPP